MSAIDTTNEFLTDLLERLGSNRNSGHSTIWLVEKTGGKLVATQHYEPDPTTFRDEYYYNTTHNVLYKKVTVSTNPIVAHWQRASQ